MTCFLLLLGLNPGSSGGTLDLFLFPADIAGNSTGLGISEVLILLDL